MRLDQQLNSVADLNSLAQDETVNGLEQSFHNEETSDR
jgi:hypothetical protein